MKKTPEILTKVPHNLMGRKFQGYYKDTSQEEILELFVKKYGYEPDVIIEHGPVTMAGPLKEDE